MKDKIIDNNKNEFFSNHNLSNSNYLIIDLPKKKNYISKNSNIIKDRQNILCLKDNYDENKKNKEEKISNENSLSKQNKKKDFLYYQFMYQLQEYFYHKNSELITEPLNQIIISRFITFCNYLMSFTGHIKKKRIFFILNKIREKIISEENLFKTKINLYHLERYFNIRDTEKIDILELYNN